MRKSRLMIALAGIGFAGSTLATNGMNLEGYGPIALAMGGASMAYDNGSAAVMNNPATLGLMGNGARLDVALGMLGPNVEAKTAGMPTAESDGDAYFMPAFGYVRKSGDLTFGAAMFAQGGMGTEYGRNTWVSGYQSMVFAGSGGLGGTAGPSGRESRSELGVGRFILPLAYNVNEALTLGGSLDFVWGGLDMMMPLGGAMLADFMNPAAQNFGRVNAASSSMLPTLNGMMDAALGGGCPGAAPACIQDINWASFEFGNKNKFVQKVTGSGWAGKLGFVWKVAPNVSIGATYHNKTSMSDFKGNAVMTMNVDMAPPGAGPTGGAGFMSIPVTGKIAIHDFQWPETYGIGIAVKPDDRWMVVADYKRLNWKDVMKDFHMTFTSDGSAGNVAMGLANQTFDVTMYQNWKDQDVFQLGVAHRTTDALTLRAGVNLADNPIPRTYLNPLFPAIVKNHYTAGFGYVLGDASDINFALSYAPKVSQSSPLGFQSEHSQLSWQLMYSHRF